MIRSTCPSSTCSLSRRHDPGGRLLPGHNRDDASTSGIPDGVRAGGGGMSPRSNFSGRIESIYRGARFARRPEAVWPGEDGFGRVDPPWKSARRADADLDPIEVGAAEQMGRAGEDVRSQKAQARAPDRRIDDQDQCTALDSGDPEAFRSGHVEVAFEGFFAAPEFVRSPYQRSEDGRIVGNDGANRLPWTGAFGVRHEFSVRTVRTRIAHRLARLPPRTDKACTVLPLDANLPGASYPSQPRSFAQETTFGNLAQL